MSPYRQSGRRDPQPAPGDPSPWPAVFVILVTCPLIVWIGRESRWELGAVLLAFVSTLVFALLRRRA